MNRDSRQQYQQCIAYFSTVLFYFFSKFDFTFYSFTTFYVHYLLYEFHYK